MKIEITEAKVVIVDKEGNYVRFIQGEREEGIVHSMYKQQFFFQNSVGLWVDVENKPASIEFHNWIYTIHSQAFSCLSSRALQFSVKEGSAV